MSVILSIVLLDVVLSCVMTLVILHEYGINWRNHRLFTRLMRLRLRRAHPSEYGECIYSHVLHEMARLGTMAGRFDIAPAGILDKHDFEEAMRVVVCRLLDDGRRMVSIDCSSHVAVLINEQDNEKESGTGIKGEFSQ